MRMNKLVFIRDYVHNLRGTRVEVGDSLGVSGTMISNYITGKHLPSLEVASNAYTIHGVVLYPYSEEALQYFNGDSYED